MLRPLSDDEKAANWKTVRRGLRLYFVALLIPALALLWFAGYGYGLLTASRYCPEVTTNKESSNGI